MSDDSRAHSDDDPRVGHLLRHAHASARVVLLGFPSDEGVRRNGGRPGAAGAPRSIRDALHGLTLESTAMRDLLATTVDAGDVAISGDVEHDQRELGDVVATWLNRSAIPIVIGGGHETAYGHFLGYAVTDRDVTILNWDAHTDVRPLIDGKPHSGSPFRQALTDRSGRCRTYIVAGLLPYAASPAHVAFVDAHGGRVHWKAALTPAVIDAIYAELSGATMVSFDLDALDASIAPGVSAPSSGGMSLDLWLQAAESAGRCAAVTSMDIVETNPRVDRDGNTSRVAALTIWHFLKGLTQRHRP